MEQFQVTGMSCAACSARVEKAVSILDGVTACSVNLLTGSMGVEGNATPDAIIAAVEAAGYGASRQIPKQAVQTADHNTLKDVETPRMLKRLIASLILLIPLMYITMGNLMWDWYLPGILTANPMAIALIELLLTSAVMVINQRFFISGIKGIFIFTDLGDMSSGSL